MSQVVQRPLLDFAAADAGTLDDQKLSVNR